MGYNLRTREQASAYNKALRYRLAQEQRCTQCHEAAVSVRPRDYICLNCWFRHMAKKATGSRKNGPLLHEIFDDQGGRCAYTGEVLIPGVNASIDHKMPTSRGGTNTADNLQWVSMRINSMKSDLSHDEFLALCRQIATSS